MLGLPSRRARVKAEPTSCRRGGCGWAAGRPVAGTWQAAAPPRVKVRGTFNSRREAEKGIPFCLWRAGLHHAPLLPSWRLSALQLDHLDRREARLGRRRDAWPVLRPSRTFKRRQPAARPRILHTRRHDQAERARCRVMVRAACEGRLWPQQVHLTDLKACRRRAVVARAETAAEEPSAVESQRLPGSPGGSPCPF